MPASPTPRQLEVLRKLDQMTVSGCVPTMRELRDAMGFGPTNFGAVRDHLIALQRKGLVTWSQCKSRTFRITRAGHLALRGIFAKPHAWIPMVQCLLCRASRAGEGPCPMCQPEAAVLWMVRDRAATQSTRGGH